MSYAIRVTRPDGGRISLDLAKCVEYRLSSDRERIRLIYFCPDHALWVYRELVWVLIEKNGQRYPWFLTCGPHRIITPKGARVLCQEAGREIPPELNSPQWNSANLTFHFGDIVCRHYKRRNARNQFDLLDTFQAAGWPRSIDSPFTQDRTLRMTIDDLNGGLSEGSPIRFRVERRKPIWLLNITPGCSG
jgi:hypothetical protein